MPTRPLAPALSRGIEILRALQAKEEMSLPELVAVTRMPRTTVIRLLKTLSQEINLVAWRAETRRYAALFRLTPISSLRQHQRQQVRENLRRLADETESTAEWFESGEAGMVLLDRAEPGSHSVYVMAREGDVFRWQCELDCVTALGYAFFAREFPGGALQTYVADGVMASLPAAKLARRVQMARRRGYDRDPYWNDKGVRRMACAARNDGHTLGVLALARNRRPRDGQLQRAALCEMLAAVERLSVQGAPAGR